MQPPLPKTGAQKISTKKLINENLIGFLIGFDSLAMFIVSWEYYF